MKNSHEETEDIWNRKKPFYERHGKAFAIISIILSAIAIVKEFLF